MRRGSLFAPLLLIGLGVLFLARNVYPDLRLLDYLAKYWPFLLILWGVLRLGEILFWGATQAALAHARHLRRRMDAGGGAVLVRCDASCRDGVLDVVPQPLELGGLDMFGESYDYPLAGEKPASKTPHVVIESFRGNARITGTDSQEREGDRAKDHPQPGSERRGPGQPRGRCLRSPAAPIRSSSGTIRIAPPGPRRVTADMEIMVPRGASIEAHGEPHGRFRHPRHRRRRGDHLQTTPACVWRTSAARRAWI